jgi:hypothetical protein
MLAVGMLAWVTRYGLFAGAWNGHAGHHVMWMVLAGIILHGICYDFFFVTGQIYVDKRASRDIRGQAQGFLVLVTQGLGLGIGAQVAGRVHGHFSSGSASAAITDWRMVWFVPAAMAALILLVFMALFKDSSARRADGATST